MLKLRILTAIVLLAGFLSALFFLPSAAWLLLVASISGLAAWEWARLAQFGLAGQLCYAFAMGIFAFLLGGQLHLNKGLEHTISIAVYLCSGIFWLFLAPAYLRYSLKWPSLKRKFFRDIMFLMMIGWLVILPLGLALVQLRAVHPVMLLLSMMLVWIADIAAFFCGRAWGRHKLAPAISPGKTWEGALGAMVIVCAVYYIGLLSWQFIGMRGAFTLHQHVTYIFSLAALTGMSIVGDLFESLVKRQAGVKDSSALLPGHGGVLDRIDSLMSTLPWVGLGYLCQM